MDIGQVIPGIQAIMMMDDFAIMLMHKDQIYRLIKGKLIQQPGIDESKIKHAVASQAPEVCEAIPPGKKRKVGLTRCDLIVLLGIVKRPDIWNYPFDKLCKRFRKRRAVDTLTAAVRSTYKAHRGEYQFIQMDNHPGIIPRLTPEKMATMCKEAINLDYIENLMRDPMMKIIVAVRRIPSSFPPECQPPACYRSRRMKKCGIPRPIDIFRSKESAISGISFVEFKKMIHQNFPDPVDRAVHLCKLPRRPTIGGFAIIRELPESITVHILCSNRSIGKNMLDNMKERKRIVYIDHPLPEVISFYEKCGFQSIDDETMAWMA